MISQSFQLKKKIQSLYLQNINEIFSSIKKSKEIKIKHDFEFVSINTILNSYNNLKVQNLKMKLNTKLKKIKNVRNIETIKSLMLLLP